METLPETPAAPVDQNPPPNDVEMNKDIAALSYLWVMSVFVYFLRRNSDFARHHSRQAMVLFFLSIFIWFVPLINQLLEILILGLMVLGFLSAAQGQKKDLPIIGPLSRREIGVREAWKQLVSLVADLTKSLKTKESSAAKPAEPISPQETKPTEQSATPLSPPSLPPIA